MIYVGNAFSLQMLQDNADLHVENIDVQEVAKSVIKDWPLGKVLFCIGHQDTAEVARQQLNAAIETAETGWFVLQLDQVFQRRNVTLASGDVLYVLQVLGGRLPEGCTELPEGIRLAWRKVTVQ